MSDLIGSLATVAVAICTALAIVAYRHPTEYQKLYIGVLIAVCSLFVAGGIWNFSNMVTISGMFSELSRQIREHHHSLDVDSDRLSSVTSQYQLPVWSFFILSGIMFWASFLLTLPLWLLGGEQRGTDAPAPEKE